MREYKALTQQTYKNGEFEILPIRYEDRLEIMKWRNEQIYHLRQSEPLTVEKQDYYFNTTIAQLFNEEKPNQILFSFLKGEECIAYGGLVHINYIDRNAEISFVIKTDLQELFFEKFWTEYLNLIKQPAFKELKLRKIYTYAFDVRERLYPALESAGFLLDARMREHCYVRDEYRDVLVHSFWNPTINLEMREAQKEDVDLYFRWANDPMVRQNSFNTEAITFENHSEWFKVKLSSIRAKLYVFEVAGKPVGQLRIDYVDNAWVIDYSVDKHYRGLGTGQAMMAHFKASNLFVCLQDPVKALVKTSNIASQRVFEQLGFQKVVELNDTITYLY
jgi:RimJ/RimL family protein N-acetyltransferase